MTDFHDYFLILYAAAAITAATSVIIKIWYAERKSFMDYLASKQQGAFNGKR